ncbi:MAG: hypothetical protein MJD61_19745 [Proteobacteria bacterium]|nr:hypothetical protein [Pseudomonadota bacterium]
MSDVKNQTSFRIPEAGFWASAWKVAAAIGAFGLVVAGVGYGVDPERFAFSYLFAFWLALTVAFGSMFFVLIQHLTGAGWSVTVRRTAEFLTRGVPVLIVLFLPVAASMDTLYPWLELDKEHGVAHAQEHAAPEDVHPGSEGHAAAPSHGGEHHDPEHLAHHAIMAKKHAYLNTPFFAVRAILYFGIWFWIAGTLFRRSTQQDESGDPQLTAKLQRFAPLATIILAFSMTFAAFDWFMSLIPNWYSTMWGVHMFASSIVIIHALIIVITLSLRNAGLLGNTVHVEHYHDLGKLQFGFLVFWGYISFSEFFLIWYSAIPEETVFFHLRWDNPTWRWVSMSLVVLHFIMPFFLILSRNIKRNLPVLGFGASWILVMHIVEGYYIVLPFFGGPELELSMVWLDLACVLGVLGVYFAVVFREMLRHNLIPIKDPRRIRAEQFVNA